MSASAFRTSNLIVSGTMSGNANITEIDTSSVDGNSTNSNYWIKVAECISDANDKSQATIHISLEGKAGDVRCGGIVYLRHGGSSSGWYAISVDLIDLPSSPNTQDNTDFVLTYDSSTTYKSQLWVRSKEAFQKCYATIIDGTRQPNENYVNFYELTPGSTWQPSITSLGVDLTATYTNRTFNDLTAAAGTITSTLDLKDGLILTGNIYIKSDNEDGFNIGAENNFKISANGNVEILIDSDNDNSNGYFSTEGTTGVNFVSYEHGQNIFNLSKQNDGDFSVRGSIGNNLLHVDSEENAVAIGESTTTPFLRPGVGADVRTSIYGFAGSKDGSTRGVTLTIGDSVVSGSSYFYDDINLNINKAIYFNNPGGTADQYIKSIADVILEIDADDYLQVSADNSINMSVNDGSTSSRFEMSPNSVDINRTLRTTTDFSANGYLLYVSGGHETVVLGGNTQNPIYGTDVTIHLSGSTGTKDSTTRGITLISGDLVVSGNLYHGSSGNSIVRSTENGRIKDLTEGDLATGVFLVEDEPISNFTVTTFRTAYVCHSSGSFEKISVRFTSNNVIESCGGLTASFHLGKSGKNINDLDTSPDELEEVFIDASDISRGKNNIFVFSGSNFEPGDAYAIRIKSDTNPAIGTDLFGAYSFVVSHFI